MSILRIIFFWSKHGCFTASVDILSIKERQDFRGSNFVRFILGVYMFCWCRLTYLKIGQIDGYVPLMNLVLP